MTEHDRDPGRPRIRITDKRRVHASPEAEEPLASPEAEEPLGSSPVTRGVPSEDTRGSETPGDEVDEAPPGDARAHDVAREDEGSPGDATVTSAGDAEAATAAARGTGASKDEPESPRSQDKASEYLEDLRRLKAEFENYRKRVGKEQTRALEMAAAPTMAKLLEVLDEFELALMAADRSPDFERFVRGVEMVYAKLTDVLRSEGLERIDAEGKPFDPSRHEALLQSEDGEGEPYVADVLRTGYTLKGRVLRPAGVKVARK